MWAALLYTIPNSSVVINNSYNGIEIPDKMNQIINYDRNGKCIEFANNKRTFSCGLGAGVMSSTSIFFTYIPEIPNIQPTDLHVIQKPQQKTSALHISDITNMGTINFDMNAIIRKVDTTNNDANFRMNNISCSLKPNNDDTYVLKL